MRMQKNFRVTEQDIAILKRLRKAKVGGDDTELFRKGLRVLAEMNGIKVPA